MSTRRITVDFGTTRRTLFGAAEVRLSHAAAPWVADLRAAALPGAARVSIADDVTVSGAQESMGLTSAVECVIAV
jgi:hypothetical protein